MAILLELVALTMMSSAAPVLIDFENLSDHEVAYFQYAERGITFNRPVVVDDSRRVEPSRYQDFAHSGAKAIEQCYPSAELCVTPFHIMFTAPQKHVRVWVGYSSLGSHDYKIIAIMRAFNKTAGLIKETSVAFKPSTGPIPIKAPLEIVLDSASIDSLTLNLASDASNPISTHYLAVDDVEYDTAGPPPPCNATKKPVVSISEPTAGQTLRANVFELQGTISTTDQLQSAYLITAGSDGIKTIDLLSTSPSLFNGGHFSAHGITESLSLGTNTISVRAQNCMGYGENSVTVTYQPCNRTLEPVVTILEPVSSDIVVSIPPRLKGNINPKDNIKNVIVIVSAGPPIYTGFHQFEIYPNDQGFFDYQLREDDLYQNCQSIISVVAQSRNGCFGQADTKIVFFKRDETKRIRGRILYEDASADGQTSAGFKPARFCKFTLQLNYEFGLEYKSCLTDSQGNFSFIAPANGLRSAGVNLGTDSDEYSVNYAVRVSKDLEYCNEYVWWYSHFHKAFAGQDLNFGDLKIGKDEDLDFIGNWQENEHHIVCGGPIYKLPGGSTYFNIADSILCAREYADGKRFDSDNIGQVAVTWEPTSHYDWFWEEIHLASGDGFNDATIVHEYGHHLQNTISTFKSIKRGHGSCDVTNPNFAWKEGFPAYLADIVPYHYNLSNLYTFEIENFSCQGTTSESVEGVVEAVLWDLADEGGWKFPNTKNGSAITADEDFDTLSGKEDIVFNIFDNEMDLAGGIMYPSPGVDICTFVNIGWMGSRLSLSQQDKDAIRLICKHYNIGCVPP
ncbi:Uncharacterised protein [uncultured archaeon]|nr:Uncharacterised protein [uncultured archaeon]